jgi:hypothetical protein
VVGGRDTPRAAFDISEMDNARWTPRQPNARRSIAVPPVTPAMPSARARASASRNLDEMMPRIQQVMKQTRVRIFRADTRSEGKLLSLFEPSTEVIRKGKAGRPTSSARW